MDKLKALEKLEESLYKLPGVGKKSAERMAYSMLSFSDEDLSDIADAIKNLKADIHFCPKCGTPIGNPQVNSSTSENYSSGEETQLTTQENQGGSKWQAGVIFFVVVIAILAGAMAYILNYEKFNSGSSSQPPVEEALMEIEDEPSPSFEQSAPIQEEKPSMQNDEEFKRKTMEYVSQIQDVMVRMNNVYNSYI